MAFTREETAAIESSMADFMAKRRPPVAIRAKLDIAWRIEGQSVVIHSIRPCWRDQGRTMEEPVAKAIYNRRTNR